MTKIMNRVTSPAEAAGALFPLLSAWYIAGSCAHDSINSGHNAAKIIVSFKLRLNFTADDL